MHRVGSCFHRQDFRLYSSYHYLLKVYSNQFIEVCSISNSRKSQNPNFTNSIVHCTHFLRMYVLPSISTINV